MKPNQLELRDVIKITAGVVGALAGVGAIVVLLVVLESLGKGTPQIAGAKTYDERYELLAKARAEDTRLLNSYSWVDKNKGTVRIPVELAMQKLLEEQAPKSK